MPELPEVETIRRGLSKVLLGQKLAGHGRVKQLRRYGKLLVLDFDDKQSLIFHLRMTGQLVYRPTVPNDAALAGAVAGGHPNASFVGNLPDKTTRATFQFEQGTLFFNDQRKFGFYEFLPTEQVEQLPFVQKLGPEPWQITFAELKQRLMRHKKSKVKAVLLDQTTMAGLGNIYADETLFLAGVHPERLVESLSDREIKALIEGAKNSMDASLKSGGSSLRNYLKVDGSYGDYLTLFANVYGRKGEPCKKCGTPIAKTTVAGRGTHFCPACQPAPKRGGK